MEITKINQKIEESNKTLAMILLKLMNPNAIHSEGFALPSPANTLSVVTMQSSTPISQLASISSPITMQLSDPISQFSSTSSPITMQSSAPSSQLASISSPITMQSSAPISQLTSISSPITMQLSTSIFQSTNISSPVTLQSSTTICQPASVLSPITTQSSTPIGQFASISSPITLHSDTPISQLACSPVSGHSAPSMIQSLQPTPTRVHFETVFTTPEQSSQLTAASSSGILDSKTIKAVRSASCSRRNFSARLVVELFDEDTRKRSNVKGKLGKLKLNPVLVDYVKSVTFQFYPLENSESEKAAWAKCVIFIDEMNRRKPKD